MYCGKTLDTGYLNHYTSCPCDCCQKAVTQDIIHIAALLRRKLPADIVPDLLEYADLYRAIALPKLYESEFLTNNPFIDTGFVVPAHIPRHSIRVIYIWISNVFFCTQFQHHGPLPPDEEFARVEVVVKGPDSGKVQPQHCGDLTAQQDLCSTPLNPITPKHSSKKLVTYTYPSKSDDFEPYIWDLDDEDPGIRQIIKEMQGGSIIEVHGIKKPGWHKIVGGVSIVVYYAVVRKL